LEKVTNITHGSVATSVKCGGFFKEAFIEKILPTPKE